MWTDEWVGQHSWLLVWFGLIGLLGPAVAVGSGMKARLQARYGGRPTDLRAARKEVSRATLGLMLGQIAAFFLALMAFGLPFVAAQLVATAVGVVGAVAIIRNPPVEV